MSEKRRDNKGRILHNGEFQMKDGRYIRDDFYTGFIPEDGKNMPKYEKICRIKIAEKLVNKGKIGMVKVLFVCWGNTRRN